jgi:hypothetical protein
MLLIYFNMMNSGINLRIIRTYQLSGMAWDISDNRVGTVFHLLRN